MTATTDALARLNGAVQAAIEAEGYSMPNTDYRRISQFLGRWIAKNWPRGNDVEESDEFINALTATQEADDDNANGR